MAKFLSHEDYPALGHEPESKSKGEKSPVLTSTQSTPPVPSRWFIASPESRSFEESFELSMAKYPLIPKSGYRSMPAASASLDSKHNDYCEYEVGSYKAEMPTGRDFRSSDGFWGSCEMDEEPDSPHKATRERSISERDYDGLCDRFEKLGSERIRSSPVAVKRGPPDLPKPSPRAQSTLSTSRGTGGFHHASFKMRKSKYTSHRHCPPSVSYYNDYAH